MVEFSSRTWPSSIVRAFWQMAVVGIVALVVGSGCHTDIGVDTKSFECQSTGECLDGWHCSPVEKVCVEGPLQELDAGGDATDAFEPTDAGTDTEITDATDAEDTNSPCGGCDDSQVCDPETGMCVECLIDANCGESQRCDTRPERQVCVAADACIRRDDCENDFQFCSKDNECLFRPCANVGDDCSPEVLRQGDNLACVPAPNAEAPGQCVRECFALNQRSTCGAGEFCKRSPAQELPLSCVASECTTSGDCGSSRKCYLHAPDFGECVPMGTLTEGSACSSGAPCGERLVCATVPNSSERECRPMCEFNTTNPTCGIGMQCMPLTAAIGACAPSIAETECVATRVGQVCTDGSVCMYDPYSTRMTTAMCIRQCRPGMQDCASGEICNTYLSAGTEDLGVCTPECDSANENGVCPDEFTCHEGRCRVACTSQSDCSSLPISTSEPGQWICSDGFCS